MLAKIMQIEEVRAIVEKTNSFTKEEIAANRDLITLVRKQKKERLAAFGVASGLDCRSSAEPRLRFV